VFENNGRCFQKKVDHIESHYIGYDFGCTMLGQLLYQGRYSCLLLIYSLIIISQKGN